MIDREMQDATEPQRGTFTFTNGDVVANLAKANGQLLRGQCLSMLALGVYDDACDRTQLRVAQPAPELGIERKLQCYDLGINCREPLQHCGVALQGTDVSTMALTAYLHV